MIINNLRVAHIYFSELKVIREVSLISNWTIDVAGSISPEITNEDCHSYNVSIKIAKIKEDASFYMTIDTVFYVQISGKTTDIPNDVNFSQSAEILQISMSHARAIFSKTAKEIGEQLGYFPAETLKSLSQKIKSGHYKMCN